jgi:tetratricopeptide (TPR) repeat protein
MAIDRDATLKQAEKLLRQGKLDGAIEEYVRLVEDQPRDWNSINALGDLYARAGKADRAVEQYNRIADHLYAEGFLPKAAALYKKVSKTRSDDEHATLRLAEIAARQELFADARGYLRQLAKQRRDRGDERGALDCLVRLASLDDADPDAKAAGGRAAQVLEDVPRALQLYKEAAAGFVTIERPSDAIDALAEAARLDPSDQPLRGWLARECLALGQMERARAFLTREAAGDDPDLLLMIGRIDLSAGREQEARVALTRLLTIAPDRRHAVTQLAEDTADAGHAEAAYGCLELVVDDAVLGGQWDEAVSALQSFTSRTPYIPALLKFVEIGIDAGRDEAVREAQARLADAYIDAGRAADARVIAEDLVACDPASDANVHRLRRTLDLLGATDADEIIARYREPIETFDDIDIDTAAVDTAAVDIAAPEPIAELANATDMQLVELVEVDLIEGTLVESDPGGADLQVSLDAPAADDRVTLDVQEIDLSDALAGLTGADAEPVRAPALDDVFEDLRGRAARDAQVADALDRFDRGVRHIDAGRADRAIDDLEHASRTPLLRFAAAARLGRLYASQQQMAQAVEWLERAAEAPAPDADEARAVMYELAVALSALGEDARALAVLMEIETEMTGYRDVASRIERLRSQGGMV